MVEGSSVVNPDSTRTVSPADPLALRFNQPRFLALVLCDWANQTDDGKTNLTGIFDRMWVPSVPHPSAPFFVYGRFAGIVDGTMDLIIAGPDGREAGRLEAQWDGPTLSRDEPIFLQLLTRTNFEVRNTGVHWLHVYYEGSILAEAPFYVGVRPEEDSNAG